MPRPTEVKVYAVGVLIHANTTLRTLPKYHDSMWDDITIHALNIMNIRHVEYITHASINSLYLVNGCSFYCGPRAPTLF